MAQLNYTTFRGLADSKWSGVKGTFPKCVGLNIHDTPGTITVNQKLSLDSGATIDALCRVALALSDGSRIWFSYTTGKIWREASGTYTLVYTTSPVAGAAGCSGAAEYNSFIYWATQSRLHRISTASIATAQNWTDNVALNWQTFSATDASFHPMVVQNQALFIGDARLVASVNSSATFTASALNLVAPNRIKSMAPYDIDLVLGTFINAGVNQSAVVRWDTVQTTWQFNEPVLENGVNAFLWIGTALVAQAGRYGNFYIYDGQALQPYKRLPGTWSDTQYGEVYPNAVGSFRGVAVFGFSNGAGNPADQGVYTMGRYSKDYPIVINGPEYIISQDDVTAVEIGAIIASGEDMYVSWTDGSSYGVDQLDYSNKYASAYLEFPVVVGNPDEFIAFKRYVASYVSLPTSTSFTFKYKANYATSFTTIASSQAKNDTKSSNYYAEEEVDARAFELRVEFNVSGNNAPQADLFSTITQ